MVGGVKITPAGTNNLGTPGTLRKPVPRDLYLAMSSTAKPPHGGKGHCLLFIINACAAATPMSSRDEQQPPCIEPKEFVIVRVWEGGMSTGQPGGPMKGRGGSAAPRDACQPPPQPAQGYPGLCKGQRKICWKSFWKSGLTIPIRVFLFTSPLQRTAQEKAGKNLFENLVDDALSWEEAGGYCFQVLRDGEGKRM